MPKTSPSKILFLKLLFGFIPFFMIYLVIDTSFKSNLLVLTKNFHLQDPWFGTTLWDFYFNITIIATWVLYKEKNMLSAILWIFAFVALGSIATSFYVFLQLLKLKKGEPFSKVLLKGE